MWSSAIVMWTMRNSISSSTFPEEARLYSSVLRLIRRTSVRPNPRFLLMLPEDVSDGRAEVRREEFGDDEAIRRHRFAAYASIAQSGDYVVIDADRDRAQVSSAILSALNLP